MTNYKYKVQYGIFWGFWQLTKYFENESGARKFAARIGGEWCLRR